MAESGNRKGDVLLIAALAAGMTVRDAAQAAGVGERTAHRRLDDPAFAAQVRAARAELLSRTVGLLSDASAEAATRLRELLHAEAESVCLGAARSVLELAPKLAEATDLSERISALEQALKEARP